MNSRDQNANTSHDLLRSGLARHVWPSGNLKVDVPSHIDALATANEYKKYKPISKQIPLFTP